VVFGNLYNGTIHTGICRPTQPVEQAEKALAWLESLSTRPLDASISGTVTRHTVNQDKQYTNAPVAGVAVLLKDSSGHESATTTDAGGAYSFDRLAAGSYGVQITTPKGLIGAYGPDQVKVHEQGCADASFYLSNDNQITGRVLDSSGKAVKGVMVALAQTDSPNFTIRGDYVSFDSFEYTDESGRYHFAGMLPGSYLVSLDPFGVDGAHPYPRQFYGGGNDPKKAPRVTVGETAEVTDIDFTVPPLPERATLHVAVRDAVGLPVKNAMVVARDSETPDNASSPSGSSGSDGAATVEVFARRSYYVTAVIDLEGGTQRCGGPILVDPQKVNTVSITIEHPIGNCMAYLNPEFKGPR
jgi:protocatechuate 3,4-dioxygenase beta subunit